MIKKDRLGNQKGFTLIEIIAVLLLLGILAAVAVPRYFDMQAQVEQQALDVAVNDMRSRIVLAYSRSILTNNGVPVATDFDTWDDVNLGTAADLAASYQNFVGTWAVDAGFDTITYTGVNFTSAAITLTAGAAGPPVEPSIVTVTITP